MEVVLTIEDQAVGELAALCIEFSAALGKREIIHGLCHLFSCTQGSQVPELHLGIGSKILYIHSIVLYAFHHPILIGIPATFDPGKGQCRFHLFPVLFQESLVAG